MYDFIRSIYPAEVYPVNYKLPQQGEYVAVDSGNSPASGSSSFSSKFLNFLRDLRLWRRRFWAHCRGYELVIVNIDHIDGKDLNGDNTNPLVGRFGLTEITVERLIELTSKNPEKAQSIFFLERPSEYAFLQINNFEYASDQSCVGGQYGLIFTTGFLVIFFPIALANPITSYALATFEAAWRVSFNVPEILNANNKNWNKLFKTSVNSIVLVVSAVGLTLLALAAGGAITLAGPYLLPALLAIPVAIGAYRVLQHGTATLFNLRFSWKTWSDPLQWRRFRQQMLKKALQASSALLSFITAGLIIGAIGGFVMFAPFTIPAVIITVTAVTLSITLFSALREYPPFNDFFARLGLFSSERRQAAALNQESIIAKLKRMVNNTESEVNIDLNQGNLKTFWQKTKEFFGFKIKHPQVQIKIAPREKIYHLGAFNEELQSIVAAFRSTFGDKVPPQIAQVTALILLVKSGQGIEAKMNDYKEKAGGDPDKYNKNVKYLYLKRLQTILLELETPEEGSLSTQLASKRKEINDAFNEQTRANILFKLDSSKENKDALDTCRKAFQTKEKELKNLEKQFSSNPKEAIEQCYNLQDLESLLRANSTLKQQVNDSTRKICHCESFAQAAAEERRLWPNPLSLTLGKNVSQCIDEICNVIKNSNGLSEDKIYEKIYQIFTPDLAGNTPAPGLRQIDSQETVLATASDTPTLQRADTPVVVYTPVPPGSPERMIPTPHYNNEPPIHPHAVHGQRQGQALPLKEVSPSISHKWFNGNSSIFSKNKKNKMQPSNVPTPEATPERGQIISPRLPNLFDT